MKKISLIEAVELLIGANAIIINNDIVTYPKLDEIKNDKSNEFLFLSWIENNDDYYLKFTEGDNENITIVGSSMFLTDHEGDECKITLLKPWNIEFIL